MRPLSRLSGMPDKGPGAVQVLTWAGDTVCAFLSGYGYRRIDTPVLEETELLLRKSGGELASKMYTFTDPGGHRVSLRPEFTSSVVRAYLQGMGDKALPVRWSYIGPVFRYETEESEYRQFTQAGAELIGASGPWADAEVLATASQGVSRLGIGGCRLVIGHLGFIGSLLEALEVSDRARLFLLNNVTALSRGSEGLGEVREKAAVLGLTSDTDSRMKASDGPPSEEALALLDQYLGIAASPMIGVRTPQEVRERFLHKQRTAAGDAGRFDAALELLAKVAQVKGAPDDALDAIRQLKVPTEATTQLDALSETLDALSNYDLDSQVSLDFGLARGIAYYTGLIFDLQHAAAIGGSLGGGGRYDGLVQALGSVDSMPAMGFAWSLEHIVDVLTTDVTSPASWDVQATTVMVRPEEASAMPEALKEAARLRAQGAIAHLEVGNGSLEACMTRARTQGIGRVVTVNAEGKVITDNVPEHE